MVLRRVVAGGERAEGYIGHRRVPSGPGDRSVLDYRGFLSAPCRIASATDNGASPLEGVAAAMRRYELMLVLRPDVPDDRSQAVIDRTTRQITASGGQILKVAPWGRRRLAYPIDRYREGSYHIILFQASGDALVELEHGLQITEEVLRHLLTRDERPARAARPEDGVEDEGSAEDSDLPSGLDEEDEDDGTERIDESESEAAPAAID